MALGPILGRFWDQVGGKMKPSWHQNLKNRGPKTMSRNMHENDPKKVMQGCAVLRKVVRAGGGSVPTISQSNSPTVMGIGTLHFVPWGHGGGYIYTYVFFLEARGPFADPLCFCF